MSNIYKLAGSDAEILDEQFRNGNPSTDYATLVLRAFALDIPIETQPESATNRKKFTVVKPKSHLQAPNINAIWGYAIVLVEIVEKECADLLPAEWREKIASGVTTMEMRAFNLSHPHLRDDDKIASLYFAVINTAGKLVEHFNNGLNPSKSDKQIAEQLQALEIKKHVRLDPSLSI